MSKYIKDNKLDIDFVHHYLLNYETISDEDGSSDLKKYSQLKTMPNLYDQWHCLTNIQSYNVVLIEIFPPSKLYKNNSFYACFEAYSQELEEAGFNQYSSNVSEYIVVLQKLVKKINKKNKKIKIVFVNGELTREIESTFIGSKQLYKLTNNIYNSIYLRENEVKFLDMNNILQILEEKENFVFESAFPYLYLRKLENSLVISRDTKHTISSIRLYFLNSLFDILKNYGFVVPKIKNEILSNDKLSISYNQRAINYIKKFHIDKKNILQVDSAQEFSLLISYTLESNDILMIENIKNYISYFSSNYLKECSDLKNRFYHIRSIIAFMHTANILMVDELYNIASKILSFNKKELDGYINFALIWLDNIFTLLYALGVKENDKAKVLSLLEILEKNSNFRGDSTMENLLKKGMK